MKVVILAGKRRQWAGRLSTCLSEEDIEIINIKPINDGKAKPYQVYHME